MRELGSVLCFAEGSGLIGLDLHSTPSFGPLGDLLWPDERLRLSQVAGVVRGLDLGLFTHRLALQEQAGSQLHDAVARTLQRLALGSNALLFFAEQLSLSVDALACRQTGVKLVLGDRKPVEQLSLGRVGQDTFVGLDDGEQVACLVQQVVGARH